MTAVLVAFGLLLGAVIGVITTALTWGELRRETKGAFRPRAVVPLPRTRHRRWLRRSMLRLRRAKRLEVLVTLVLGLLLSVAAFLVLSATVPTTFQVQYSSHLVVGAIIGVLAAPWLWLHFAHEPKEAEGANTLDRYRFLTFVLLGLLVIYLTHDVIRGWLERTTSLSVAGFTLNLNSDGSERARDSVYLSTGAAGTGARSATAEMEGDLLLARRITGPERAAGGAQTRLRDIYTVFGKFEQLGTVERDQAYAAFLRLGWRANPSAENLLGYVTLAEIPRVIAGDDISRDIRWVGYLEPLADCALTYSRLVRDARVFAVEGAPFMRDILQFQRATERMRELTGPTASAASEAVSRTMVKALEMSASASMGEMAQRLDAIDTLERATSAGGTVSASVVPCGGPLALPGGWDTQPVQHVPSHATPYPTLLSAHFLSALDSAETGVRLISDWLSKRTARERQILSAAGPGEAFLHRWMTTRAMLEVSQMAARPALRIANAAQAAFQRQLVAQFEEILSVPTGTAWRAFCVRISGVNVPGPSPAWLAPQPINPIHAGVGQRLGFSYALERSFLHSLQESSEGNRPSAAFLANEIEYAEAFIDTAPTCFSELPLFRDARSQWVGLFRLNLAQLLVADAEAYPKGPRRDSIRHQAREQVRLAEPAFRRTSTEVSALSSLSYLDSWESYRDRLGRLKSVLNEREP